MTDFARPLLILFLLLFGSLATSCEPSARVHSPHWGKDTCQVCRMAITEAAHAAQLVGPGAQVRYYDDLGCAVNDILTESAPPEAILYVPDPTAQDAWVRADEARFVAGAKTPMDYGYTPAVHGELTIDEVIEALHRDYGERWRVAPPSSRGQH